MDTAIEIDGLSKHFHGKSAVDRLNLTVPSGSIFALLGDNGAGKTTTIRTLTGLLKPDAGSATILGLDCWRAAAKLRPKVGYVPERPKFYDWMTIAEIGWFTSGFYPPGFLPRYQEITKGFELDSTAKLQHLSKGQYAKVGLALALAPNPEVLILDEPTSGLDLLVRRDFLSSMVGLRLQLALALYQLQEKKPASNLQALVPRYLPELPLDPFSGKSFHYRVSTGESISEAYAMEQIKIPAGQGILWSVGLDGHDNGGSRQGSYYQTPDPALWNRGGLDLIFLVTQWSKSGNK